VPVIFSIRAMLLAFDYMPASAAARLDPAIALGRE
jgi:hypothetical protein